MMSALSDVSFDDVSLDDVSVDCVCARLGDAGVYKADKVCLLCVLCGSTTLRRSV